MKRQHAYEQLIGRKLNGVAAPDVTGLWENMELILDREMPQQQRKKRFGSAWWFSSNVWITVLLFTAVGTVYTLCRAAGRDHKHVNSKVANLPLKNSNESLQRYQRFSVYDTRNK